MEGRKMLREVSVEGRKYWHGRKEDTEGSKYLGKEVLVWKEGRY